ncbi:hypothetical protein [Streptomyces puniciscabiei]|uniref:hypothetical protein n=1 Tax=Streptomyces puniciscabiei TaxID=164348 RepID=UPI003EC0D16E
MNNAGTTRFIPQDDLQAADAAAWREFFDVNVFGVWQLTTAAVPYLEQEAVAGLADLSGPGTPLLPQVENMRTSSATVAVAVARRAAEDGVARAPLDDVIQQVQGHVAAGVRLRDLRFPRQGRTLRATDACFALPRVRDRARCRRTGQGQLTAATSHTSGPLPWRAAVPGNGSKARRAVSAGHGRAGRPLRPVSSRLNQNTPARRRPRARGDQRTVGMTGHEETPGPDFVFSVRAGYGRLTSTRCRARAAGSW